MTTLRQAYQYIESKLTPEYLEKEGLRGESLVVRVIFLNQHFLKIRKAIKIYGPDFKIPFDDRQIPSDNRDIFMGCVNWQPRKKQYKEK